MATQIMIGCSTRNLHYKKLSLDPDRPDIRLLEVRPAQSIRDTISGRLVNLPLTPDLDYVGLSALYGGANETEPINIDGKRIDVPANLGQALRHLRTVFWPTPAGPSTSASTGIKVEGIDTSGQDRESVRKKPHWLRHLLRSFGLPSLDVDRSRNQNTLRIWIDAFCINERDAREQREQHTLMATAYRHARTVVGWLGPKDETSDLAVRIIRDVDRAVPPNFGSPEDRALHPENYAPHYVWMSDIQHLWQLPEGVTDPRDSDNFIAMSNFLSRQYFQRDWILNEIAMATFPTFLIGKDIVSWCEVLRWNRFNEELTDVGAALFPDEFRKVIDSFMPLGTVYTMLKEFERTRDNKATDFDARTMAQSSLSNYSM
ncbi:Heterokaryon incompatibility protein 6, OR allele [Cytospora mali]|uniref:Heterokaryon incompatibility protein 6, OR allele n=1 Tax=Cytospora mali TaxID=578113 RepID=A0A194UXH2_CYTMA|nr:Heterokaryon incompatibility protein 6, OR allele [Valsa mali var. pyri (nom. inval.)]